LTVFLFPLLLIIIIIIIIIIKIIIIIIQFYIAPSTPVKDTEALVALG